MVSNRSLPFVGEPCVSFNDKNDYYTTTEPCITKVKEELSTGRMKKRTWPVKYIATLICRIKSILFCRQRSGYRCYKRMGTNHFIFTRTPKFLRIVLFFLLQTLFQQATTAAMHGWDIPVLAMLFIIRPIDRIIQQDQSFVKGLTDKSNE